MSSGSHRQNCTPFTRLTGAREGLNVCSIGMLSCFFWSRTEHVLGRLNGSPERSRRARLRRVCLSTSSSVRHRNLERLLALMSGSSRGVGANSPHQKDDYSTQSAHLMLQAALCGQRSALRQAQINVCSLRRVYSRLQCVIVGQPVRHT